jgi:hypothetical protein
MGRRLAVVLLVVSLTACGKGSIGEASGGISGSVTAGPTCPVERADSPCPPRPWTGTVRATDVNGKAFDTQTDPQGTYALHLPPGTYTVAAVTSGMPSNGTPQTLTVGDAMLRLDLRVDTGIR